MFTNFFDLLIPPSLRLKARLLRKKYRGLLDPEMLAVEGMLREKRNFLDIGANVGIYSLYFSPMFNQVHAFEPISEITQHLKRANISNVIIHNVAVSDTIGELELRIPVIRGSVRPALASLEARSGKVDLRDVSVLTIDSLAFEHVDLIKIDVEGHELSVIEGAKETLTRCRPIILMEIEQRHIDWPIEKVFHSIEVLGFAGRFIANGEQIPLNDFDILKHQRLVDGRPKGEYVNNFIFVPTLVN